MVVNKKPIKIFVEDGDAQDETEKGAVKQGKKVSSAKNKTSADKKTKASRKKSPAKTKKTVKKVINIENENESKGIEGESGSKKEVDEMNLAIKKMIKEKVPKVEKIQIESDSGDEQEPQEVVEKAEDNLKVIEKPVLSIEERLNDTNSAVKDFIKKEEAQTKEGQEILVEENLSKPQNTRSLKLYRRIAYFFITLTVLLIAVVLYFTFANVSITLIPNQERMSNSMIFDIFDKDNNVHSGTNSITGIVKEIEITKTKSYESQGEQIIGKEVSGKVKIINNYVKNQPLVATTRFLTSDQKLFRLKETVNVPAGGVVEAEVYADDPSPDMAITKTTTFTIPGLWAGLQDKIYAESVERIEYKKKVKKYVTVDDIENSIRDLKQQLLADVKTQINDEYKDYGQILYRINEESIASQVETEAGDEVDDFDAYMEARVVVVAFNEEQAANLAEQKFVSSLPDGREMLEFDKETIVYSLNNYDSSNGSATINATFEGKVSLNDNYDIVKLDRIVGLNEEQLNVYLNSLDEIAGFEVYFRPSFIKRVPRLQDKIEIIIKK